MGRWTTRAIRMLDAPGIHQDIGGPLIVRMPDGGTITYDFKTWTITRQPGNPLHG